MSFSQQVVLASQSDIKIAAVGEWLLRNNFDCCIEAQKPGATKCKQPIGTKQALKCIKQRVKPILKKNKCDCIVIAVENFLQKGVHSVTDYAMVAIFVQFQQQQYQLICCGNLGVTVPTQFDPTGQLDENGFCQTTAGQLLNEQNPEIPADNWHEFVSNVSRTEQIVEALESFNDFFRTILSKINFFYNENPKPSIWTQQVKAMTDFKN